MGLKSSRREQAAQTALQGGFITGDVKHFQRTHARPEGSETFAIISLDYLDYKSKHFFFIKTIIIKTINTSKNCRDGVNVEQF